MEFWLPALLLTGLSALALLYGARRSATVPASGNDAKLAIYKDQLSEIDRDMAAGLLPASEAEAQKTEVARRMLATARQQGGAAAPEPSRNLIIFLALLVPLLAVPAYLQLGKPTMRDLPRNMRMANAEAQQDLPAMIAKVEEHLWNKPNDASGWQILIPNYMSMERYADAANAMVQVMRLKGPDATLYANFAEAMTLSNKGLMGPEAVSAVDEALKLDAKLPKARYYKALGIAQSGKKDEALTAYKTLLAESAPDAPWRPMVSEEITRLETSGVAPQISTEQMANAEGMTDEDRNEMIRGMVDGLEEKLQQNANDLEGWLRIIRARTVLNEPEKAKAAFATATTTFKQDAKAMAMLNRLAEELKLK